MAWYIKKISIISGVPVDGVMYKTEDGHWTNVYENRQSFDSEESAITAAKVDRGNGVIFLPNGVSVAED